MGGRGLEPPTLAGHAPKACAYTNSATRPSFQARQVTRDDRRKTRDVTSNVSRPSSYVTCRINF